MMELVDVTDSKSVGATRVGSSPTTGTYSVCADKLFLSAHIFFQER